MVCQLPQDAYRHAYAGRLPSPEERQLDVAAGLRVSASNMFSTGFRIEPRVDYLEEAIALVRVLPPSPARDLELAKCLRLLSTALSIRARYPSTARTASDVPRARQSLMESRDLFEVLKSANQLPAPEILELQNTTALLANLDAQLPATQSTISTQP